ncbi:MAG: hypothetical protein K6A44_06235 [bacterium]|nr:hypothetical protein [bacterium]
MGLSATQMRFLMVTARKSNVEYQGQQINQARTALANQSADLFAELMSLKAPTAPSIYQYVINPTPNPTIDWRDDSTWPLNETDAKNFMVYYAGNEPYFEDFAIPQLIKNEDGSRYLRTYLGKDENGKAIYEDKNVEDDDELNYTTYFEKKTGKDSVGNDVKYFSIHVNENANFGYDIETGRFTGENESVREVDLPKWAQAYNLARVQYETYSKPKKEATYTEDFFNDTSADGYEANKDVPIRLKEEVQSYDSTATISYNQAQYDAAMAEYEKDLEEYERTCDQINAKTDEIHEADKKLELQLKQLDTEQEAIQTEYEALKKVLEKNIENTYKTFG